MRINLHYPLAHYYLAQIFERKGEIKEARKYYQQFPQLRKDADADIPEIIVAEKFLENS